MGWTRAGLCTREKRRFCQWVINICFYLIFLRIHRSVQYFKCKENHGLFIHYSKVAKDSTHSVPTSSNRSPGIAESRSIASAYSAKVRIHSENSCRSDASTRESSLNHARPSSPISRLPPPTKIISKPPTGTLPPPSRKSLPKSSSTSSLAKYVSSNKTANSPNVSSKTQPSTLLRRPTKVPLMSPSASHRKSSNPDPLNSPNQLKRPSHVDPNSLSRSSSRSSSLAAINTTSPTIKFSPTFSSAPSISAPKSKFTEQNQHIKAHMDAVQSHNELLKLELDQLRRKVADSNFSTPVLSSSIHSNWIRLQHELEAATSDLLTMKTLLSSLNDSNLEMTRELEIVHRHILALKQENALLVSERDATRPPSDKLVHKSKVLSNASDVAVAIVDSRETELQSHDSQQKAPRASGLHSVKESATETTLASHSIQQLIDQSAALKETHSNLELRFREVEQERASADEELEKSHESILSLNNNLQIAVGDLNASEAELSQVKSDLQHAQEAAAEATSTRLTLQIDVQSVEKKLINRVQLLEIQLKEAHSISPATDSTEHLSVLKLSAELDSKCSEVETMKEQLDALQELLAESSTQVCERCTLNPPTQEAPTLSTASSNRSSDSNLRSHSSTPTLNDVNLMTVEQNDANYVSKSRESVTESVLLCATYSLFDQPMLATTNADSLSASDAATTHSQDASMWCENCESNSHATNKCLLGDEVKPFTNNFTCRHSNNIPRQPHLSF